MGIHVTFFLSVYYAVLVIIQCWQNVTATSEHNSSIDRIQWKDREISYLLDVQENKLVTAQTEKYLEQLLQGWQGTAKYEHAKDVLSRIYTL